MTISEKNTELRIREAATNIFTQKGYRGARMQEIANEARINKAMLHYYYRSKEKLFMLIMEEKISELFAAFAVILQGDLSFEEKIYRFVDVEIDALLEYPDVPLFVINEIGKEPEILEKRFANGGPIQLRKIFAQLFDAEIKKGNIKKSDPNQFIINLMSLCVYPFLARPIVKQVLQKDNEGFRTLMMNRKKIIPELLLNDILIKK